MDKVWKQVYWNDHDFPHTFEEDFRRACQRLGVSYIDEHGAVMTPDLYVKGHVLVTIEVLER